VPPLPEGTLVQVQPMLLWANHHTGAHEAHVGDDLIRSEAVLVDQVCSDEAPGPTQPSLAVNSNALLVYGNHLVRQVDELADQRQRWASAVVEDHVQMLDTELCEVGGRVELRIQAHYQANVARAEVRQDVLERPGNGRSLDLRNVRGKRGIHGRRRGNLMGRRLLR